MDYEALELPAVRLAPYAELAQSVRSCDRLRSMRRLAEWVGPSRKVTAAGDLTLADARRAVQDLMLPGDQGPGRTPARSASEFPELQNLWELVLAAELLHDDPRVVRPGPALEDLRNDDDEEIVDVWADVLAAALEFAFWDTELSQSLIPTLMALYVSSAPIPELDLAVAAVAVQFDVDAEAVATSEPWSREVTATSVAVEDFVRQLVELDAAVADDGGVRLTPLGRYGVNCWLGGVGADAPAVMNLADASASELIGLGVTIGGPDELDALFTEWTAARGPEQAADELIDLASQGDAAIRVTAFSLLDRIGPPAEQAVWRGLEQTATRPHAKAWLQVQGFADVEPEPADLHWLLIDAIVATLDDGADAIGEAVSGISLGAPEQAELVGKLWRCGHPQAVEALDALSRHHPDTAVAKAARKGALQARSAAAPPAKRRTSSKAATATAGKSAKARAKAKTAEAKAAFAGSVCQVKITLVDVKPPVWRRITVPAPITLPELHAAIQIAMGWTDSHLHEFEIDGRQYGVPDPDWDSDMHPEAGVRLLDTIGEGGRLRYVYDFGDDWRHDVQVEKLLPAGTEVPVCLTGRRACPPEDVGGPWGYADFLAAYGDPAHPEHDDLRQWAGAGFEPDRFDPAEVTELLRLLFL